MTVEAMPVGDNVTAPCENVGVPKTFVVAMPVSDKRYTLDRVTVPITAVLVMPVGERLTAPGVSIGTPNASVLAKPVMLSV
jgi:hypothetical protein